MWPQELGLSRVAHRPRKPIHSPFTMHTTRTHSAEKEGCSSEIPIARRRSRGRGPRLLLPLLSVADARRHRGFIGLAVGQAGSQAAARSKDGVEHPLSSWPFAVSRPVDCAAAGGSSPDQQVDSSSPQPLTQGFLFSDVPDVFGDLPCTPLSLSLYHQPTQLFISDSTLDESLSQLSFLGERHICFHSCRLLLLNILRLAPIRGLFVSLILAARMVRCGLGFR